MKLNADQHDPMSPMTEAGTVLQDVPSNNGKITSSEKLVKASSPDSLGRFRPGNRYGRGRPAGSRNRATLALEQVAHGAGELIVLSAIRAALGGDTAAMKIVLDRIYPIRRGRPVRLDGFPDPAKATLTELAATVLVAVSQGLLTTTEGSEFTSMLESYRRARETDEIEQRLRKVEEHCLVDVAPHSAP